MDSERVIDMTEEELIAANLAALGLDPQLVGVSLDDAIFDFYVTYAREHGALPVQNDVAERLKVNQSTISQACKRLVKAGRMKKLPVVQTGREAYLPIVTGAK